MFVKKNKYYIYIENLSSINLHNIKNRTKFNLIYRNNIQKDKLGDIIAFVKKCKKMGIKFYIANDLYRALSVNADGIYLSSYNKRFLNINTQSRKKFKIIGSAHNFREINIKKRQGCEIIILSRLFKTNYKNKNSFMGITKFNLITKNIFKNFVALGGIRSRNLMKIKILNCEGIALLSEVKKKPAIIRRLF